MDAAQGRRRQPDDASAVRPVARQEAERTALAAAALREPTRTLRGAAKGASTGIEYLERDTIAACCVGSRVCV